MGEFVIPNWNLSHQRQNQVEEEEQKNIKSLHVHSHHNSHSTITHLVPMSKYDEIAELTWDNVQLSMNGLGGLFPAPTTNATCHRPADTLESIVCQATTQKRTPNIQQQGQPQALGNGSGREPAESVRKRSRSDSRYCGRNNISSSSKMHFEHGVGTCGSASATFCRDKDSTLMTWASFESPQSLNTKNIDHNSDCHDGSDNGEEEQDIIKGETGRSESTRRSRSAAVHNQSEQRRRGRINQKMKALQKLVPNSSKTDKASMLDEAIEYLKKLQAQVQFMSMRNMSQMVMPLGMQQQQQFQMPLLARMPEIRLGLGMGMGMIDMNAMARGGGATPSFVQPPFMVHPMMTTQAKPDPAANTSFSMPDPFCACLAQSTNMELYNKMAALYSQQVNHITQPRSKPSRPNHEQRD